MTSLRSIKQYIGLPVSPSPEIYEPEIRGKRRGRAESPPPLTSDQLEALRIQAQAEEEARQQIALAIQQESLRIQALEFMHNHEVDEIIFSINEYLSSFLGETININIEDPSIRFIVGMIVTSNTNKIIVYQKLRRSRLLLQAVASFIISRLTTGVSNVREQIEILLPYIQRGIRATGRFLFQVGATTGRVAYNAVYNAASSIRSIASRPRVEEVQGRAASPPPQRMYDMASAAYESMAAGLSEFYSVLSSVLREVYVLLAPCVASAASRLASVVSRGFKRLRAMCSTPEQAVAEAVAQVVPQEQQQDSECAICMTAANFIDERGVNYGPLGYVEKHRNGTLGHPDRFHRSCLQGCHDRCPMCRAPGPVWGTKRPPGQGGGGSKKYRSKSKSKSRRYLSKPHKSRKARKRVRHFSSRRK